MLTMSINKHMNTDNWPIQVLFAMMRIMTKILLTFLPSLGYRIKVHRNQEDPVDTPDLSGWDRGSRRRNGQDRYVRLESGAC